jgi:tyrosyl-tRNA synthetase
MGGNDQWSNIIGGVELIRKVENGDAYGLTFKLLTTKEGKKMGKTEKGALWLDSAKTSPYEFYQYWRNIADEDVKNVLCLLTFLPIEEINKLSSLKDEEINEAKKVAAFEITKLIHGETEAIKAKESAEALFGGARKFRRYAYCRIRKQKHLYIRCYCFNKGRSFKRASQNSSFTRWNYFK